MMRDLTEPLTLIEKAIVAGLVSAIVKEMRNSERADEKRNASTAGNRRGVNSGKGNANAENYNTSRPPALDRAVP